MKTACIGIIGGADGPTAIYVSGGTGELWLAALAVATVAAAVIAVIVKKKRRKP